MQDDDKVPGPRAHNERGWPLGSIPIANDVAAQFLKEPRRATDEELIARLEGDRIAPNARAFEKKELVLPHIYIHGIADATVLCTLDAQMTLRTAQQTLSNFASKNLVARADIPGVPVKVYRLTPEGARWVLENAPSECTAIVRPWVRDSDIPQKEAEHKLLIQLSTHLVRYRVLPELLGDTYSPDLVSVKPERILRARNEKLELAHKFPDAVVEHEHMRVTNYGEDRSPIRIAIEAQESAELAETSERVVTMYCEELRAGTIDYVIWTSTKPRVAAQYDPRLLDARRCEFFYHPEQMKWFRRTYVDQFGRRQRIESDFSDVIGRILTPLDLSQYRGRYYRR